MFYQINQLNDYLIMISLKERKVVYYILIVNWRNVTFIYEKHIMSLYSSISSVKNMFLCFTEEINKIII